MLLYIYFSALVSYLNLLFSSKLTNNQFWKIIVKTFYSYLYEKEYSLTHCSQFFIVQTSFYIIIIIISLKHPG